jgi:N-acetylmuramoyl-L-alanine amidase
MSDAPRNALVCKVACAYALSWALPSALACGRDDVELSSAPEVASGEPSAPGAAARKPREADGVSDADLAALMQRTAKEQPPRVTLERITVYGAEPNEARLSAEEREVRVVLHFDGVAVYRRSELPPEGGLPRRLVLDLDGAGVSPAVERMMAIAAGGLARVRTFVLDEDRIRVAFDVGATTAYRVFFLSDPYRVVMDFRDRARERSRTGREAVIVLDPGHGGHQSGAKGPSGIKEAHVALSLARLVRQGLLRRLPGARVVLTRNEDKLVSLEGRTALANALQADLFVSIHLNASESADDLGGVSTFVLDTSTDAAALRLAARENGTDEAGVTQLQLILASLYREDQAQHSLELARVVQHGTLTGGRTVLPTLNDRGVKRALFYVLVGAQMPAVLVEASFITRPEEAKALATDEYRSALAEGMADGIARYITSRRVERGGAANGP